MKSDTAVPKTVDAYIAGLCQDVQHILRPFRGISDTAVRRVRHPGSDVWR